MDVSQIHSPLGFTTNIIFWASFWSWCSAQCIKMLISFRKTNKIDFRYLGSTGGMPSAHSATVAGLATSTGMLQGFDSALFALSCVFAIITMFDASTVRYQAGRQAAVLNQITAQLNDTGKPKMPQSTLKELLGHTKVQVFAGLFWGIFFSVVYTLVSVSLTTPTAN